MNIPRLIIADEFRPGKIPAGVMAVCVLKELGYKVRAFVGGADETSTRLLQVLLRQPVTVIDPMLIDRPELVRWLFQENASEGCLNIIIASLGCRVSEELPFSVQRECLMLADMLDCDIVPVIYSDASSALCLKTIKDVLKQIGPEIAERRVRGMLFRSTLNDREYQLVDMEVGRQLTAVSIGSVPRHLERDEPLIADLCGAGANKAVIPARAAIMQLKEARANVMWPALAAFATAAEEWQRQPRVLSPIEDAGKVNIAVLRDPALTLGGNGTETLFRLLGCNIVDIPIDGDAVHSEPLHGVYIPHGLGYLTLGKLFSSIYIRTLVTHAATGAAFMLAEGGAAPILGDKITMPPNVGGEGRGFGAFRFSSRYVSPVFGTPKKLFALSRKKVNPLLTGSQEWITGYWSPNVTIEPGEGEEFCWDLFSSLKQKFPECSDGVAKGRMLASAMRIEPWCMPETLKRWLAG